MVKSRIKQIKEEKGLKREDVASKIGTSAAIIAKNVTESIEVSLEYLVGVTSVFLKDKKMLYRLEFLQKVNQSYKDRILYMLDLMLKDAQNNSLSKKLA